ncbi:HEAT repeat domain-containing protein [Streptomyces sp. SAS_267]|uniref:HEAT repeat domain-containing protein n=1 Tax=Streptomyces sp. SAS_267 TaxID=3412750 RepID=UPI00403D4F21
MASLGERLRHRKTEVFERALGDAVMDGPAGEAELVAALSDLPLSRHVSVIAVLGDAQGSAGPQALRHVLTAEGMSRDVRCAAALALAKRCGPAASADLAQALSVRDSVLKRYAMVGLAGAGDDSAWDQAFVRLKQILRRSGPPPGLRVQHLSAQSQVVSAICYLGRHLDGAGGVRSVRLIGEVRGHWDRLGAAEQAWLTEIWPGCLPDGPPAVDVLPPESRRLESWIRDLLFGPAH